jgi:hypothetical protein
MFSRMALPGEEDDLEFTAGHARLGIRSHLKVIHPPLQFSENVK